MHDLRQKLADLEKMYKKRLARVQRAKASADTTKEEIDAIRVVLERVLGEEVPPLDVGVTHGYRRHGKARTRFIAGAVRAAIEHIESNEFTAQDIADVVRGQFGEQHPHLVDDQVRKVLARLARDGEIETAEPGGPSRPATYKRAHEHLNGVVEAPTENQEK